MSTQSERTHRALTYAIARAVLSLSLVLGALLVPASLASATLPPIKHVFVLVDENESESTSFGPSSPAPYLSKTLVSKGAFVPYYYGVGHSSLDNYIAMVSGQAPNASTQADCHVFSNFAAPTGLDSTGQETNQGCVYPRNVPTLMGQLGAKGLTWRGYMDGMGANPLRESATCGHPLVGAPDLTQVATPTDQYATRHDPFVYFHSVIDNRTLCQKHVVNLSALPNDLKSAARTPNFVFITPNLCDDGHDATCANGGPGGLAQADRFLQAWVPKITNSPAFKQNGLLIVTFDEAVGDATACCHETPGPYDATHGIQAGGTGPGGGVVGAVMLSPFIKAGTRSAVAYNHFSMLGSVEDMFGLSRLGEAVGTKRFGNDIFTAVVAPQDSSLKLSPRSWSHKHHPGTTISYTDTRAASTRFTVVRELKGYRRGRNGCTALQKGRKRPKHTSTCSVAKTVSSFTHRDKAGKNRVRFGGRVAGKLLGSGQYLLKATPKLGYLIGRTRMARFTVR